MLASRVYRLVLGAAAEDRRTELAFAVVLRRFDTDPSETCMMRQPPTL